MKDFFVYSLLCLQKYICDDTKLLLFFFVIPINLITVLPASEGVNKASILKIYLDSILCYGPL